MSLSPDQIYSYVITALFVVSEILGLARTIQAKGVVHALVLLVDAFHDAAVSPTHAFVWPFGATTAPATTPAASTPASTQ